MIFAGAPVPEVITLVVIIVIGDLMPGLLVTPALGDNPEKISSVEASHLPDLHSPARASESCMFTCGACLGDNG